MSEQESLASTGLVAVAVPQLALDLGEGRVLKAALCLVHRRGRATLRSDHQTQSPAHFRSLVDVCQFSHYIHPRHNGYTGHPKSLHSGV
jgi:hypothetical protein